MAHKFDPSTSGESTACASGDLTMKPRTSLALVLALGVAGHLLSGCLDPVETHLGTCLVADVGAVTETGSRWWKGNLHTHSLWSDGDHYPEPIVDWYKRHSYHFLVFTEHNRLLRGERWINVAETTGGQEAYESYLREFGPASVDRKEVDGELLVRLKTLEELCSSFAEPGSFLLMHGEEITDAVDAKPVDITAMNLVAAIRPLSGATVLEVLQRNTYAVVGQRLFTHQTMLSVVSHPNLGWAVTPHDLDMVQGTRLFELYSGNPSVSNEGDEQHASMEEMWDIVLTRRVTRGEEPIYGLAVDDAHSYHALSSGASNPGRGWVMVRASQLTPGAILAAMEAGDFYSSTGVTIADIRRTDSRISLIIQAQQGVTYATQFIGTRTDQASLGVVLAQVTGTSPSYTLKGDELYVRAKVISSQVKAHPQREGELEVAWTQPFLNDR